MSDVKQIDSSAINRIKTLNTNIISNFSTSSASKPTNTESVAIDIDLEKASNPITEFFSNLKDDASDVGAYISDSVESITKYEWFQDFTDFAMDNVLPIVSKVGEVIARTGATVGTVVASLIEGILGFGGSLIDLVAIVGSAVLSIPTGIIDGVQAIGGLITGDDWDSVTKALWGKTKGFVETKYVENLFDSFYDTKVGKALKDNAYFFDTTRSIGTGVGNIAGTVALTVLTFGVGGAVSAGGSAASAAASSSSGILSSISSFVGSMSGRMAITAAASGIGKGTEEAWSEGASIGEGLVSGGLTGLWEGIQFYLGGKIGDLKVFGKSVETAGTKLANSLSRVILDGIDGGFEGIVQPLIASVYKDGYYDEDGNYIKFKETDNIVDKYGEIFDDYGGVKNILTNAAIGSGLSILGEAFNLNELFNNNSTDEINANVSNVVRQIDDVHGYQLNESDITGFYKNRLDNGYLTKEELNNLIDKINKKGYMSKETGEYITNLFNDSNYDVYTKTIKSTDLESIKEKGLYCNNNTMSNMSSMLPESVDDINLDATITRMDNIINTVNTLKTANGYSQGMNPIDGTIILKIPKNAKIEDIVYFNQSDGVYCINPKYIDSFFGVDENGTVSNINGIKQSVNSEDFQVTEELFDDDEPTLENVQIIDDEVISNDLNVVLKKMNSINNRSDAYNVSCLESLYGRTSSERIKILKSYNLDESVLDDINSYIGKYSDVQTKNIVDKEYITNTDGFRPIKYKKSEILEVLNSNRKTNELLSDLSKTAIDLIDGNRGKIIYYLKNFTAIDNYRALDGIETFEGILTLSELVKKGEISLNKEQLYNLNIILDDNFYNHCIEALYNNYLNLKDSIYNFKDGNLDGFSREQVLAFIKKIEKDPTNIRTYNFTNQEMKLASSLYTMFDMTNLPLNKNLKNNLNLLSNYYLYQISDANSKALSFANRYGVNQGALTDSYEFANLKDFKAAVEEAIDVVKKYFPDMKKQEIVRYLDAIDSTGACSYAAVLNDLYMGFSHNERAFKEIFGYDMYKTINGQKYINDRPLLADLYTFANYHNKTIFTQDSFGNYRYIAENHKNQVYMSNGITGVDGNLFNSFLKYKIVNCNNQSLKNALINYYVDTSLLLRNDVYASSKVSKDVLKNIIIEQIESGKKMDLGVYVDFVNDKNFTMYQFDDKTGTYDIPFSSSSWQNSNLESGLSNAKEGAGHAMAVSGVTNDGIIVASWGKEYYIPFEELQNIGITLSSLDFSLK